MASPTSHPPAPPPPPPHSPHLRQHSLQLARLPPLQPELHERAWASTPHPTLPLVATAHGRRVTVYSLATLSAHSTLAGGHARSVRCAAWKPALPPHRLCLVTGSFDSTAGLWRWEGDEGRRVDDGDDDEDVLETEVTAGGGGGGSTTTTTAAAKAAAQQPGDGSGQDEPAGPGREWEFTLVLEGHDSEIKSAAFSPAGQYLATCSRDKAVWVWEDVGAAEADDEWETVAVLTEHDGDVKAVAWCPDVPGRASAAARARCYGPDVLASAGYDDAARVWRQDADGEWACVAVLEGHAGTVWSLAWEADAARRGFPRLLSGSADGTVRVWELRPDVEAAAGEGAAGANPLLAAAGLGGIPNTMRRGLREDWVCAAVLPAAHTRDVYSVAWSPDSGRVASTGSDGVVAVYAEEKPSAGGALPSHASEAEAAAELDGDGDAPMQNGHVSTDGAATTMTTTTTATTPTNGTQGTSTWRLLTTVKNAHGPYEVNHVAWCRRYDAGTERRGEEEMLLTTGDDGVVRPWKLS